MPKLPGIKLGKPSLLHPAPVTGQEVVSLLLQSSQLCCLPSSSFPGLLAQQEPLGVWCHSPDSFDKIRFGLEELWVVCAPDPPLWSVLVAGLTI